MSNKQAVHDFWNAASCGEAQYLRDTTQGSYATEAEIRYRLEPYILGFADFESAAGKDVLEIGVGLGADHLKFAQAGARMSGVDLTRRAIEHTERRFQSFGLQSKLQTADAENLPFPDNSFDIVYSWGVLHHSPNTANAIGEVHRVLRRGGIARVMVYHTHSFVGYMLWARYALLTGKPWRSLRDVYSEHLESPGTKAYTVDEAQTLFRSFSEVHIETILTHGDLLTSDAGQRHRGALLSVAKWIWPRQLIQKWMPFHGLFMLIRAIK